MQYQQLAGYIHCEFLATIHFMARCMLFILFRDEPINYRLIIRAVPNIFWPCSQ